jgi:hypothetical protein
MWVDSHVAESPKADTRSDVELTVNEKSRAQSLDDKNTEHRLHAHFVEWTVPEFGERSRICVVLDVNGKAKLLL